MGIMLTMRCAPPLFMTDDQRDQLEVIAGSPSLPHRAVRQAAGLLAAADGLPNEEIGRRVGVSANTVRAWRASFVRRGVEGVGVVAKGRGRKSWLPPGMVAEVVRVTLYERPPDTSTHWTTRTLAKHLGIGKDSVAKIWRDHELKPWRVDTFKISNDPRFEDKLVDVVGLYLDPPARAVVFSFDEKTQCQALDRTQPSLPMRRGRAGTMTHDYKRNGTTDLFAALNIATGEVLTQCRDRHTAADVLAFFKKIDRAVPRSLDIHVILDNLSAHAAPEVTDWLAHPRRARWHLHFTPTSSSWLNLVERWFKELTDRRLRRGTFSSVADLIQAIETWVAHRNTDPKPFVWHAAADEILEKVRRGRKSLSQVKSATQH
jgi:transposase